MSESSESRSSKARAESLATARSTGGDAADVAQLLGRIPAAPFHVARRCPHGRPAVIENDPVDGKGRPFPTRYWLVCHAMCTAVSRLEADGGVEALDRDVDLAPAVADAHRLHGELHAGYRVAGAGDPAHVKCLHAHLALGLARDGGPVSDWILERSGARWPERCCIDRMNA